MTMHHEFVESLTLRLVLALLHFLWQGCAVVLVVTLAARLLSPASAHIRYTIHVIALAVMVLCLPVTFALLEVSPRGEAGPGLSPTARPVMTSVTNGSGIGESVAKGGSSAAPRFAEPRTETWMASLGSQVISLLCPFAPLVAVGYVFGVAIMMLRLSLALRGGRRLCRSAIPVGEDLVAMIDREVRRMGLKVAPMVAHCERISVPIVVGILKPTILLPWAIVSGLAPDQLQTLLAHEMAHIRRFDLLVNLFQRQAEALLFFHPAVWFVSRRVSTEREIAADDLVLAAGWDRVHYANALVHMAELSTALRRERHAALAAQGSGGSEFKRRVLRLLFDDDRPTIRLGRTGGTFFVAALILIAFTPILVQAWAPPADPSASPPAAQSTRGNSGKSAANPFDPHIVIAEHVILWDQHVVTWDQVVKRLRAKRAAGPFHANFSTTYSIVGTTDEQYYQDRIDRLSRELFKPTEVTYHRISMRGSAIYDAIRTAEDTLPNPKYARSGRVVTPEGKPAADAQVIVLPAKGPLTVSGVVLSGTQLRDPLDEQWVSTGENGQFTVYPREADDLLMVLHPSGCFTQKVLASTQVLRLEPWATVTLDGKRQSVDSQQTNVSIRSNGSNSGEPGIEIFLLLEKDKPVEIKVPAGTITVGLSLAILAKEGEPARIHIPVDQFSLNPGESHTSVIKFSTNSVSAEE